MNSARRFWIMFAVLVAATAVLNLLSHGEAMPLVRPLAMIPTDIDGWSGKDLPIEQRIIDAIQVDDHLSRVYYGKDDVPVIVYIGFYKSQRTGQTIHSPKNCLPGAGWEPVSAGRTNLQLADGRVAPVNLYVIEKGLDRQIVLYWYQSHGRIVASEYWGKYYMVRDALRLNRTDAALVRISTPVYPSADGAEARAGELAKIMMSHVEEVIPR